MTLPRKCTATKVLLFLASLLAAASAWAGEVAGTVVNLSGPLLARKPDGSVKALSVKSSVEQGDTLVSEKDTYARIKFIDNSEITLRPNSQFKIESFSFDEGQPEKDSAVFNLVKGGLRAVTGTLGKRNHERFGLNTPTATIGIRGTIFIAEYIPPTEPSVAAFGRASLAAASPDIFGVGLTMTDAPLNTMPLQLAQITGSGGIEGRAPGLYVQVLDGMINLRNQGGSLNFSAGQFGYTPSMTQPPVVLPQNPGIHFQPPPVFQSSSTSQSGTTATKSSEVDCEVR